VARNGDQVFTTKTWKMDSVFSPLSPDRQVLEHCAIRTNCGLHSMRGSMMGGSPEDLGLPSPSMSAFRHSCSCSEIRTVCSGGRCAHSLLACRRTIASLAHRHCQLLDMYSCQHHMKLSFPSFRRAEEARCAHILPVAFIWLLF